MVIRAFVPARVAGASIVAMRSAGRPGVAQPRSAPVPRPRGPLSPCAARLEALAWPAGLSFAAYGARIGVRVSDPTVLPWIESLLPAGAVQTRHERVDHLVSYVVGDAAPQGRVRRFHVLYAAARRFQRTLYAEEARGALEHHLELAVAEMAPRRLFVHAGVVGWKGRAIVIPGRSHSGKSSLVAALLARGASYLSDEFAVVDGRGRVYPYPRRLRLRNAGPIGISTSPRELGARTEERPLPVGLIAIARYAAGARWRPRVLSPGRAVLELLANSVTARKHPELAMAALEPLALRARALKGSRGEAAEAADQLIAALEGGVR
jgi:hypothetical protein